MNQMNNYKSCQFQNDDKCIYCLNEVCTFVNVITTKIHLIWIKIKVSLFNLLYHHQSYWTFMMLDLFFGFKRLIRSSAVHIDTAMFRLHWLLTSVMLISFSVVVTARQYGNQFINLLTISINIYFSF